MKNKIKLEFWNNRAKEKSVNAGTDDFMLKKLEMKLLLNKVPANSKILDLGCGNGVTLNTIVEKKECKGVGLDFSYKMLEIAKKDAVVRKIDNLVEYIQGDLLNVTNDLGIFDCIITQRSLINLDSTEEQYKVFNIIKSLLKRNGLYIMIESFNDGLNRINKLRKKLNLYLMEKPWHNTFFNENDVKKWESKEIILEEINYFASTYYYLSRVVYAKYAEINNEKLKYDSDINKISLMLPAEGNYGSVVAYIWRKI